MPHTQPGFMSFRFTPPAATAPVERNADFLATVPLFRELPRETLRRFAALVRQHRYGRGQVVVSEGDPGDALFLVRAGEVKVVLVGEDGREVILDVLASGAHFGELSLIDGRPRSAHVIATQTAQLLILRREDFRREIERSPAVAWALLGELSRRLRQADATIGSLVLLDVPGRVARVLLEYATPGEPADLVRPLPHHVIGQMIGASRESVSRAMSDFQEKGWIRTVRRRVTILDREALEARTRPLA